METYSITIRPRPNNFKVAWLETIRDYLDAKKPGKCNYVIAGESGDGDNEINHIQMALAIKSRSDNIRRMIKSVIQFEPEDDMERQCWCKISKSDDPFFTNGYCLKEKKMIMTNYEADNLDKFDQYYKKKVSEDKHNGGWECKSINELPYYLQSYAEENIKGFGEFSDKRINGIEISMRALAYKAFGEGKLPFSLVRKLKKSDEIIFEQLVCPNNYRRLCCKIETEDRM